MKGLKEIVIKNLFLLIDVINCDGSSVLSVCEDLPPPQENDSPIPVEQVRKESDSYNWNITHGAPDIFKSTIGYQANHALLNSLQTSSGSSRQLVAVVRIIQEKKRPTSKYQPTFKFKPYEAIPAKKVACRPSSWVKLGYIEKSVNQEKKDFGIKTEEKVTNCFNNFQYAVRYIYLCIIICIIGNLKYGRNLVNTWQPSKLPIIANRIPELKSKVKINPEICCKDRKQYDKSYKNFWNIYEYVITIIRLMSVFLRRRVKGLKYLGLQTTNSCSSNFYTLVKIGANSCQMMEKLLYKSYYKFRNGHSCLE